MKKQLFTYALCAMLAAGFTACDDLLTEDPNSSYQKELFFTSEGNASMAVTAIYDSFGKKNHYGQNEMATPCSDDTYYIDGTGTDNTRRDIAHYMVKNTNTWIQGVWDYKYEGINRANYAIAGIEGMDGYKDNTKLITLVAEARFLRAFLAFDLVKCFGDVPFKTTFTNTYEEAYQPRISRELIYDEIIKDLNFAKEKLDWNTILISPEKASQGAARALLMRVLLQRAGYSLQMDGTMTRPDDAKRAEYFDAVIKEWEAFKAKGYHDFCQNGYVQLFKNFSHGDLDSKESIFEISFYTVDANDESDTGIWGTYNGPLVDAPGIKTSETGGFMGRANAFFRVVKEWKDFFEATDVRRDVMVCTYDMKWDANLYNHKKVEVAVDKGWYPGKWRREWMPLGFKNPNNTNVNYCPLRYADVVLMAAEAYNETDNSTMAWTLINDVRIRSGATAVTAANYNQLLKAPKVYNLPFIADGDEKGRVRTALYWERAFELAFEGQRKYDLIRWNILPEALTLFGSQTVVNNGLANNKKPYPAYLNFTKGQHELLPIPLSEMQSNPKLENKNNPGY